MTVDIDFARRLTEVLITAGLTKIDVSQGNRRIRIVREPQTLTGAYAAAAALHCSSAASTEPDLVADPVPNSMMLTIRSPHVGTVHLADRDGGEPFAPVGRTMKAGDTLLLIEMMKVRMPVVASSPGMVVAVLVHDGEPVEFDQLLIALNQSGAEMSTLVGC